MSEINVGDRVGIFDPNFGIVTGVVIKQYFPTACEQQTMIIMNDGRKYHAPTRFFRRV